MSDITPETFEGWVRAIVAHELAQRSDVLQAAVQQMLDRHDETIAARLRRDTVRQRLLS